MAISKAQKAAYNDEIKPLKQEAEEIEKKIREITQKKQGSENLEPYYNLEIVHHFLRNIQLYLRINELSIDMLGIKNSKSLDNGKSNFSKLLQIMKETVGDDLDRDSLRDNEDYLERIDKLSPRHILDLIYKVNDVFRSLKNSTGEDSKWKWLFVELQAKVAIITRNMINFSDIQKYRDPRQDFYHDRKEHLKLAKDSLTEAAKQYRTKYELSAKSREDLKKSIELLEALRKIHMIMGESDDADKLKTTIDAARFTLEAGDKKKDNDSKSTSKAPKKH